MEDSQIQNRYKGIRWVADNEKIILGPKREYKPLTLRLIAYSIMIASFIMIVLFGSETIRIQSLSPSFVMIVLFLVFLYGVKLNGVVREALALQKRRKEEIEDAYRYAKERKHGI